MKDRIMAKYQKVSRLVRLSWIQEQLLYYNNIRTGEKSSRYKERKGSLRGIEGTGNQP